MTRQEINSEMRLLNKPLHHHYNIKTPNKLMIVHTIRVTEPYSNVILRQVVLIGHKRNEMSHGQVVEFIR